MYLYEPVSNEREAGEGSRRQLRMEQCPSHRPGRSHLPFRFRGLAADAMSDPINHPSHYTSHPSGVECIDVTEHYGFCVGNAIKYLWRAGLKGDAIEDLKKARWYIDREIRRREKANG